MSLLDTLRKTLSPELFGQVTDALGDDFNYDLVPRSRLNTVIGQRDAARRKLDAMTQGVEDVDDDDDQNDYEDKGGVSNKKSTKHQKSFSKKDIDMAVQQANAESDKKIALMQIQFAATEKLRAAKFVDPQLVLNSGLLNLDKVTVEDLSDLDSQIAEIAKARPYLLISEGNNESPRGTGRNGGSDEFGAITNKAEFLKLSTDKQLEFKKANPDIFKAFMSEM